MDYFTALCVAALVLLFLYTFSTKRPSSAPPGPTPLPLIGNLFYVARQHPVNYIALHKISKKYGDLTSIRIGPNDNVLVSSSEAAVDLYSRQDCLNRPTNGAIWDRMLKQNIGMAFSNDAGWNDIRKFTSKSLRQFGFGGRAAMANMIKGELLHLVDDLQKKIDESSDGVLCFDRYFQPSLLNLMSSMITGSRHDYDEEELKKLLQASNEFFDAPMLGILTVMAFPFTRYICPGLLGYTMQIQALNKMQSYARKVLEDCRRQFDLSGDPTCFTELFLKTAHGMKDNPASIFTDDQFAVLFTDLIQGGSDTTANWLSHAILQMTVHPQVQERVFQEIVTATGGGQRKPEPQDQEKMPYTRAVMLEIHRHARLLIIEPPRHTTSDFYYRNYLIKKGTTILVNLHSCYMDEDKWEEPTEFRPERFLSPDQSQVVNSEKMGIIFGAGRRICFGEVLAKDSSFLYLATLLQAFSFSLPKQELNYPVPEMEPPPAMVLAPKPYYVQVKRRTRS